MPRRRSSRSTANVPAPIAPVAAPIAQQMPIQKPHRSTGQKIKEFFGGKPEALSIFQRFDPEQQQALSQLLQMGLGGLQQVQPQFQPIEDYYMRQFGEQLVPSIAERFTSLGGGAQQSSAFPQILGQQAGGLASQLAALRANYNLGQQGNLMNMIGMGLTPRFESAFRPAAPGFGQQLLGGIGQGASAAAQGFGRMLPFMF